MPAHSIIVSCFIGEPNPIPVHHEGMWACSLGDNQPRRWMSEKDSHRNSSNRNPPAFRIFPSRARFHSHLQCITGVFGSYWAFMGLRRNVLTSSGFIKTPSSDDDAFPRHDLFSESPDLMETPQTPVSSLKVETRLRLWFNPSIQNSFKKGSH